MSAKYQYKSFQARQQKLHKNYNHKRRLAGKPPISFANWAKKFKPKKVFA